MGSQEHTAPGLLRHVEWDSLHALSPIAWRGPTLYPDGSTALSPAHGISLTVCFFPQMSK